VRFGDYVPHNYENDYRGAMTVANAFAESRNIPALKLAARVAFASHRRGPPLRRHFEHSAVPAVRWRVEITLQNRCLLRRLSQRRRSRGPHLIRKVSNGDGITLCRKRPPSTRCSISNRPHLMTLLRGVTAHGTASPPHN